VKRFRGGLVFKAHRLLYHSNLGSKVINKKKKHLWWGFGFRVSVLGLRVEGQVAKRSGSRVWAPPPPLGLDLSVQGSTQGESLGIMNHRKHTKGSCIKGRGLRDNESRIRIRDEEFTVGVLEAGVEDDRVGSALREARGIRHHHPLALLWCAVFRVLSRVRLAKQGAAPRRFN